MTELKQRPPVLRRGGRARIIAFANQKGGVGKTTTTCQLAASLAAMGLRVLLVDMDSQANLTTTMDCTIGEYTMAEVLEVDPRTGEVVEGAAAAAIVPAGPAWPQGIDVLPGAVALAVRELDQHDGREYRLRRTLKGVTEGYDVVLIDCPPSIGQLTLNGLVAADEVWVLTEPARLSEEGTGLIMTTIERAQRNHNPSLELAGVVITMHTEKTTEARTRTASIREHYGTLVYAEPLPHIEVINKATGAAAPLSAYGAEGRNAWQWYGRFGTHLTTREAA